MCIINNLLAVDMNNRIKYNLKKNRFVSLVFAKLFAKCELDWKRIMCDLYCIFLQCDYAMRQRDATARDELRTRPLDLYMNSCRATRSGERNVFGNFVQENGDVLLVTQCGIHLWGFRSDKKVVQLLIRMLLQRFCTVSKKTYYVFHIDTVLCRIASLCEKWVLQVFATSCGEVATFQIRCRPSHRKNEVQIGRYPYNLQ